MDTDVERLLCTAESTARDELFHFIVQVNKRDKCTLIIII